MFRSRAVASHSDSEGISRPLQQVTIPAAVALALALVVLAAGTLWLFGGSVAIRAQASGVIVNPPTNTQILAPASGVVELGPPLLGTVVKRGQQLGMVTRVLPLDRAGSRPATAVSLTAPIDGMVVELNTGNGGNVVTGDPIVTLAPLAQPMISYLFVASQTAPGVARGDAVSVSPVGVNTNVNGTLIGSVEEVVPMPASPERIRYLVSNRDLADEIINSGPVNEVVVSLASDPQNPQRLTWTKSGSQADTFIISGTQVEATIELAEESPWRTLLGIGE